MLHVGHIWCATTNCGQHQKVILSPFVSSSWKPSLVEVSKHRNTICCFESWPFSNAILWCLWKPMVYKCIVIYFILNQPFLWPFSFFNNSLSLTGGKTLPGNITTIFGLVLQNFVILYCVLYIPCYAYYFPLPYSSWIVCSSWLYFRPGNSIHWKLMSHCRPQWQVNLMGHFFVFQYNYFFLKANRDPWIECYLCL